MTSHAALVDAPPGSAHEPDDIHALVDLVDAAAALVRNVGETAFGALRAAGSRWRRGDRYVFVLDPDGNVMVHPDPAMEAHNRLALLDVQGTPIVRGLIAAVSVDPHHSAGWLAYRWPAGDGPARTKLSYVRLVHAPSGSPYIVGSGLYSE